MPKSKPNRSSASGVGYGKPPVHTRFKKGQSGNPGGRPRRSKSLAALIDLELDRRIRVTEGGKLHVITKKAAAAKQFVNKVAGGDPAAIKLMLGIASHEADPVDPEKDARTQEQVNSIADILDEYAAYKRKYGPLEPTDTEPPKADTEPPKEDKGES